MSDETFRAKFDQSAAVVRDTLIPHWRSVYLTMLDEGFTEQQAMELLKVYIAANISPSKA